MRNLIASERALELLDATESGLSYAVHYRIIPTACDRNAQLGMRKNGPNGEWYLGIPERCPLQKINDYICAHELLHIKIRLEGWPNYDLAANIPAEAAVPYQNAAWSLISSLDHIEIEARLQNMGLADQNEHLDWVLKTLTPSLPSRFPLSPVLARSYGPDFAIMLDLFSALAKPYPPGCMSMASQTIADHIRLAQGPVEAFEKTRQMLLLFGDPPRISRECYHSKLMGVLSIAKLPQEYLRQVPL